MDDEINLLDYWRVIVKRRWLIISLAVICAFVALFYSLTQPKLYKATTTIMVVEGGGGGLASSLTAIPFIGELGSGGENKLISVLKSTALAKMVAQRLNLQNIFPKLYQNNELTEQKKIQSAAGNLKGAIEAKNLDGLLNISIVWKEPSEAAEITNLYVDELSKFLNTRSLSVNFQIIDLAVAPTNNFKPKVQQNIMLAFFFGIFTGIFIAFFLEYLEKQSSKN